MNRKSYLIATIIQGGAILIGSIVGAFGVLALLNHSKNVSVWNWTMGLWIGLIIAGCVLAFAVIAMAITWRLMPESRQKPKSLWPKFTPVEKCVMIGLGIIMIAGCALGLMLMYWNAPFSAVFSCWLPPWVLFVVSGQIIERRARKRQAAAAQDEGISP